MASISSIFKQSLPYASVAVGIGGILLTIHKSSTETHDRIAKLEGIVSQLVTSVDNLEEYVINGEEDHKRKIENNEKAIKKMKKKISDTQKVLAEIQ